MLTVFHVLPSSSASSTASSTTMIWSPGHTATSGMLLHQFPVRKFIVQLQTHLFLSASIGHFAPQKYVWKVCIALHSAPRLLICQMYHTHMQRMLRRDSYVQQLALFTCTLNVAEVFSLLLLSVVPSVEDFTLHKLCFGSFLFFSAFFISSSVYLFR